MLASVFFLVYVFYHLLPCLTCLLDNSVEFTSYTDVWPCLLSFQLPPITCYFSNTQRVIYRGQLGWDHVWHFGPIALSSILLLACSFSDSTHTWTRLAGLDLFWLFICGICLFVCLFALTAFLPPTVCLPDYWVKPCIITYSMLCLRCLLFLVPFQYTHGTDIAEQQQH